MARLGLATLVSLWCRRAAGESFNLQAESLHDRVTSLSQPSLSDLHFISPPYADPPLDGETETVELLDTVLVASVDGRFHAIDRTTGKLRWSMSSSDESNMQSVPGLGPLVRSRSPIVDRDDWDPDWDTYVIEPQSGDIFVVPSHAGPSEPLHKLGISVDSLVEHSPFSIYGDKPRTFIGKKETSLLSIDLRTGRIASFVNVAEECKWDDEPSANDAGNALASWHDSDDEQGDRTRGRSPTVSIGRTDYYVTVYAGGKKIQHLSYSRYGPNNIDNSLQMRWTETPDALYMQSHPRGHLWAFSTNQSEVDWLLPHFEHPIVSIFDVVTVKGRADPVALLQPRPLIGDLIDINKNQADAIYAQLADRTYVGKILNALYAMSAKNYPLVAFDMQDRQTRPVNEDGEPSSGYQIGGAYEDCTKPECMVGRWRTHNVRPDREERFIDPPKIGVAPKPADETKSIIPIIDPGAAESMAIGNANHPRVSDPSNLSTNADLPALWSSPKAYGPAAAFMVAIFLWVVIQKTSNILPHRHRSTVAEHKPSANETSARSPDMTPVPSTPIAAPVDMTAQPVKPIAPLDPPVVLTVATSPEVEVPDPVSDSGAQGGDDGSEGEDNDKDNAATPGKRHRTRRKRVRKPKNKATSGDQAGLSDAKDDGKDDAFVLVESDAPVNENTTPNVQLVLPTPPSPASAARIAPASLVVSETVLGFGSHGTIVYQGAFQGRAVAVKRLLGDFTTLATREVQLLQESDDHPNVIRYFFKEHRDNFLYIALELCPASLADIVERPDVFRDISIEFDPKRALSQITAGIRHLHSLKIIHRDIKPQNILISHTKNGARRMLISDFGLCKKLDHDQTSFLPTMHGAMAAGTVGWRAPEILRGDVVLDPVMASDDSSQQSRGSNASGYSPVAGTATTAKRLTKSVDVFALGCLFYYTLTNGDHPYGDRFERESNILKNEYQLSELERLGEEGVEAMDLIAMMLDPEPKKRPDTLNVLLHPFFWTPGRRLAFLQDASDRFEIMCRDPRDQSLIELETGGSGVVGHDWHARLDRIFIENLGKFRKYDGRTVQDLLRALRNKKHHYQDMPDNVKRHLGPLPEGFLAYFTRRFPALFMHVHAVISRTGLNTEPMFRSYFELAES